MHQFCKKGHDAEDCFNPKSARLNGCAICELYKQLDLIGSIRNFFLTRVDKAKEAGGYTLTLNVDETRKLFSLIGESLEKRELSDDLCEEFIVYVLQERDALNFAKIPGEGKL